MSVRLRRGLGARAQLALPTALARPIANAIGHVSLVRTRRPVMRREANLGRMNDLSGPMSLQIAARAALGVYLSAAIRVLARPAAQKARPDLTPASDASLAERVFMKRHP